MKEILILPLLFFSSLFSSDPKQADYKTVSTLAHSSSSTKIVVFTHKIIGNTPQVIKKHIRFLGGEGPPFFFPFTCSVSPTDDPKQKSCTWDFNHLLSCCTIKVIYDDAKQPIACQHTRKTDGLGVEKTEFYDSKENKTEACFICKKAYLELLKQKQ